MGLQGEGSGAGPVSPGEAAQDSNGRRGDAPGLPGPEGVVVLSTKARYKLRKERNRERNKKRMEKKKQEQAGRDAEVWKNKRTRR